MVAATQQRPSVLRSVIAGLAGAVVGLIITLIGFMVADPILFDPDLQSAKLIAVWDETEPLPPTSGEAATGIILLLIGIGRAFIYRWLAPAWPTWPGALR